MDCDFWVTVKLRDGSIANWSESYVLCKELSNTFIAYIGFWGAFNYTAYSVFFGSAMIGFESFNELYSRLTLFGLGGEGCLY